MAPKLQPTTIRLSEDDQTFLASLKLNGGSTISDKVRCLINDRRLLQEAGRDYKAALQQADNLLAPLQNYILMAENNLGIHSQMLGRTLSWSQEMLAVLLTNPDVGHWDKADPKSLENLEAKVIAQIYRLLDIILQTYLSRESALYNVESLNLERLKPIQRLSMLLEEDNNKHPDMKKGD